MLRHIYSTSDRNLYTYQTTINKDSSNRWK